MNPINHNKPVYGVVVSSYSPDPKLLERADCDYAFIRINPIIHQSSNSVLTSSKRFSRYLPKKLQMFFKFESRCSALLPVVSPWNKVKQFEERRCGLIQKAEDDFNQPLLYSSVETWRSSSRKKSDLKLVSSPIRRWKSFIGSKPTQSTVSKQSCASLNVENLEARKDSKDNNHELLLNSKAQNRKPIDQQIRKKGIPRKLRTECNNKLWQSFNGPWFDVSFSW